MSEGKVWFCIWDTGIRTGWILHRLATKQGKAADGVSPCQVGLAFLKKTFVLGLFATCIWHGGGGNAVQKAELLALRVTEHLLHL